MDLGNVHFVGLYYVTV